MGDLYSKFLNIKVILPVGAQNIVSLFKMFSSIRFNNLLEMKTKHANVSHKVRKLGNIISSNC